MTDANDTENEKGKTARRTPRTRWILMGIAGALVLVMGGVAWSAVSYSKWSGGGHDHSWFVEREIDRMLDEVEASDDQRGRVHAIVKAAVADLQEVHELKREGRQALVAALTRDTIDRAELETLRQSKLETVDRMSQRMLTALADAAEVLTPAQRKELAEEWHPRGARDWHD